VHTHRHNPERRFRARGGHADPGVRPRVHQVCGTSDLEIERGYAKEVRVTGGDRSTRWCWLRGLGEGAMARRDPVTSQQSVRQAVRRSALDAQAVRRKERAERQRRLEVWRSR
jgi:hypothetical protein